MNQISAVNIGVGDATNAKAELAAADDPTQIERIFATYLMHRVSPLDGRRHEQIVRQIATAPVTPDPGFPSLRIAHRAAMVIQAMRGNKAHPEDIWAAQVWMIGSPEEEKPGLLYALLHFGGDEKSQEALNNFMQVYQAIGAALVTRDQRLFKAVQEMLPWSQQRVVLGPYDHASFALPLEDGETVRHQLITTRRRALRMLSAHQRRKAAGF